MNQKKRITYLDMAKGVGIILMIAGHLIGSLQAIDNKPYFSSVYQFIASFHMPLFFLISGYFLSTVLLFRGLNHMCWNRQSIKFLSLLFPTISICFI